MSGKGCHTKLASQMIDRFTSLPQPLLELILISHTSSSGEDMYINIRNKKALRQTCRLFQRILDGSMVSASVTIWQDVGSYKDTCISFFTRMQRMHSFKELSINLQCSVSFHSLLGCVPELLTTLAIYTPEKSVNLRQLGRLKCLSTLRIHMPCCEVEGLEHITGLTRLETRTSLQAVAHLAPTLKHLEVGGIGYNDVAESNKLINLEGLVLRGDIYEYTMRQYRQLPIRYMMIDLGITDNCVQQHALQSLPPTLTQLGLQCTAKYTHSKFPSVLPASITYLQLLNNPSSWILEEAATALPGLKSLDLCLRYYWKDMHYFKLISKFTGLTSLRISEPCLYRSYSGCIKKIWSDLKKIQAAATSRGVQVEFVKDKKVFEDVFFLQDNVRSSWAVPA